MFNFAATVDHNLGRFPDKVVLIHAGARLTNTDVARRVNALASALTEHGIQRGDVVAMIMNNRPEFIESALAINRIGAIFLPINTRLAPPEWHYILEHSAARAVICEGAYAADIDSAETALAALHDARIVLDGPAAPGWTSYEAAIAESLGKFVPVAEVDEGTVHRLMYTSGTTSRPKGVPLTYRNLLWKNYAHLVELGINSSDRVLVCGPLYHVGALDAPALDVLQAGGSLLLHRKFDVHEVLSSIQSERPTIIWLAPTMINMMLQDPRFSDYDLSSLRLILFGGEKAPRSLIAKFTEVFPNAWLSDAYGLTETAAAITFNDHGHTLSKAGSVGRPVIHVELKAIDPLGDQVPNGVSGEIVVRGPQVFSGYLNNPTATDDAFIDGWFRTGDIGHIDDDGYLFIEDRMQDRIVSGGENISSSEVERVLYEHVDVLEAAVVAAPDTRWGEVPRAFVVTKQGRQPDMVELQAFCRKRLAAFKVPKYIEFVDTMPRNATGKILKRELRHREVANGSASR
ncbi:acyl-CoA synthetase [Rhodococcus opacus]|uniref:acyl-CoA synthetase n=1 Tax=Rhodococcus opacus TaxID=37919 RepID=UPI001C44525E|nr:long-chain fatty acid--CoA ligase [Rhodococcus opacus]MBV6756699.1 long-chain fatty acid--CoA ligase [Rhodococcus opacus]